MYKFESVLKNREFEPKNRTFYVTVTMEISILVLLLLPYYSILLCCNCIAEYIDLEFIIPYDSPKVLFISKLSPVEKH